MNPNELIANLEQGKILRNSQMNMFGYIRMVEIEGVNTIVDQSDSEYYFDYSDIKSEWSEVDSEDVENKLGDCILALEELGYTVQLDKDEEYNDEDDEELEYEEDEELDENDEENENDSLEEKASELKQKIEEVKKLGGYTLNK